MNQTQYVIVLEVDHLRARAAYAKGVADLAAVMPSLIASAKAYDVWRIAQDKKEEEERKKKEGPYYYGGIVWSSRAEMSLKETEDFLKNKKNIADAAISSFRMTEADVLRMIAFEDGSEVQRLVEQSERRMQILQDNKVATASAFA